MSHTALTGQANIPSVRDVSRHLSCTSSTPLRLALQTDFTLGTSRTDQASVTGQLNIPIYDGGLAASQTRQAKETATQSRLVLEQVRNQTRTAVVSAWVASEGAKVADAAAEAEVAAATVALQGVQREAGRPAHDSRRAQRAR